jgi:lysophospholipase L1-like esterase
MKRTGALFPMLLFAVSVFAQSYEYPYQIDQYDFIHYNLDRFEFFGDSSRFTEMYSKYDRLVSRGEGRLTIVHIGGSHLQADIYSDRMRKRLQTFQPGNNGGRGFVFPYSIARTNNPTSYKVAYSGKWVSCKNVEKYKTCTLGLSGISVTTADTTASITLSLEPGKVYYDFNRARIFHQPDSTAFDPVISAESPVVEMRRDYTQGITEVVFEDYIDHLTLSFRKTDSLQDAFVLYGLSLETDDPGVVYHSIGVNGAKLPSYLRCQLLEDHLVALDPDLVVLSLGTNDAYTRYFQPGIYRANYDSLIERITTALPGAAILLTVPNDSYLYRRYINRNTEEVRDVIYSLAEQYNCGVWDFYTIMGGLNSIIIWQRFGMAKRDRIHFTRKGYELKGDLFFNAFLKSYDNYLDHLPSTSADGFKEGAAINYRRFPACRLAGNRRI